MEIRIDVCESDVQTATEVMEKIAESQDWDITLYPDYGTGEDFRIVTKEGNREGTYSVANDEIEWDDGEVGSLFSDYEGNKYYTGENLLQFLDVTTAIWGVSGNCEIDEELVLYTE